MSKDNSDRLTAGQPFTERLKIKSRGRRGSAARLAAPGAAPRALRNDVLPTLEIIYLPLGDLRSPARKVRKIDPAYARDVAGASWDFVFPF
jgi:hypothetical protein